MQISGHKNVAFINNYSTLSEERHKKISNILSNTESETNRNAFQQTYLVKPPQILQPVAPQRLGASEKKKEKKNYIILQGGELTCFHFFKSSC